MERESGGPGLIGFRGITVRGNGLKMSQSESETAWPFIASPRSAHPRYTTQPVVPKLDHAVVDVTIYLSLIYPPFPFPPTPSLRATQQWR